MGATTYRSQFIWSRGRGNITGRHRIDRAGSTIRSECKRRYIRPEHGDREPESHHRWQSREHPTTTQIGIRHAGHFEDMVQAYPAIRGRDQIQYHNQTGETDGGGCTTTTTAFRGTRTSGQQGGTQSHGAIRRATGNARQNRHTVARECHARCSITQDDTRQDATAASTCAIESDTAVAICTTQ